MSSFTSDFSYAYAQNSAEEGDLGMAEKLVAGTVTAVTSGVYSLLNTGRSLFGGDEDDNFRVEDTFDGEWGAHYKRNKDALDAVGFVGTSIIPGGLAIKGLKALRAGLGEANAVGKALSFFSTRADTAAKAAAADAAVAGGTVFDYISANALKAMGWNTAEAAFQTAVSEAAVALSMSQSPVFADNGVYDMLHDGALGVGIGGGVGGVFGALTLTRSLGKVNAAARGLTAVSSSSEFLAGLGGVTVGDKAAGYLDALVGEDSTNKILNVSLRMGSDVVKTQVDLTKNSRAAIINSNTRAVNQAAIELRAKAPELADWLIPQVETQRKAGLSIAETRSSLLDVLSGVVSSEGKPFALIGEDTAGLFYLNRRSGAVSDWATPTAADAGAAFVGDTHLVKIGGQTIDALAPVKPTATLIEDTARMMSASRITKNALPTQINDGDIPMLKRMLELGETRPIEGRLNGESAQQTLERWQLGKIVDRFSETYEGATHDELAAIAGVTPGAVRIAVRTGFNTLGKFENAQASLSSLAEPQYIGLRYAAGRDLGTSGDAYFQRLLTTRTTAGKQVAKMILGDTADRLPGLGDNVNTEAFADVAPGTFSAANADYGNASGLGAIAVGATHAKMATDADTKIVQSMHALFHSLDDKDGIELLAIRQKVTGSSDRYQLVGNELRSLTNPGDGIMVESPRVQAFLNGYYGQLSDQTARSIPVRDFFGLPNHDARVMHLPAPNPRKYPFHAFVRPVDQVNGNLPDVSMVYGRTQAELQARIKDLENAGTYQIITDKGSRDYHKAIGDYEFSKTFYRTDFDSTIAKTGRAAEAVPSISGKEYAEELVNSLRNRERALIRSGFEAHYAQELSELKALAAPEAELRLSATGVPAQINKLRAAIPTPERLANLILNRQDGSQYGLWGEINSAISNAGRKAGATMRDAFSSAQEKKISWEDANKVFTDRGLLGPFSEVNQPLANLGAPVDAFHATFRKLNALSVNATIRMDLANSVMNVISSPVLQLAETQGLKGHLDELMNVKMPGTEHTVPTAMKVLALAQDGMWRKDSIARYERLGILPNDVTRLHEQLDSVRLPGDGAWDKFSKNVNKAVDTVSKVMLNSWTENYPRVTAARAAEIMTDGLVEKGIITAAQQDTYIVNLVAKTNSIQSSLLRPHITAGPVGAAATLYMSYAMNMMQFFARNIGDGNAKAALTAAGVQGMLFGMGSIPGMQTINNMVATEFKTNSANKEAYSQLPKAVGSEMAHWMLYGTASAFPLFGDNHPALFSRGDISPRSGTVIPVNPMDYPAVQATIQLFKGIREGVTTGVATGDAGLGIWTGLEMNGISRPLAGLARIANGSHTSKGSLISAQQDALSLTTLARLAGTRPMDEALALDAQFRTTAFQAANRDKMESLGAIVKRRMTSGDAPTDEEMHEFMDRYVRAGGNYRSFNQTMVRWRRDATQDVTQRMKRTLHGDVAKRYYEMLGGDSTTDDGITNE